MKNLFSTIKALSIYPIAVITILSTGFIIPSDSLIQAQQIPETQQSGDLQEAKRLNDEVIKLYQQGKYNEAIPLAKRSLSIAEKALGSDHPDVANSLNNLAALYKAQGNYSAAEPLYKRSLSISEKALGSDHPDVATSLGGLAELYRLQGNYSAAEPLLKRSLSIKEKALGSDHPDVATSLNNLGLLYRSQGNYSAAEPLYKRAVSIDEKVLGSEHPELATSLNNLGLLYLLQGNYSAAESLFKRSLSIYEKTLGIEHPSAIQNLSNLGILYRLQGNYNAAESLHKRVLSIREKTLGVEHPLVAQSLNNLGLLYRLQGNYSAAASSFERVLSIDEKVLGLEHPETAITLNNLAGLYEEIGLYSAAERLYKLSLSISEKALGSDHPDVATSLNNLAGLYKAQGNYSAAEPLYKRSLSISEKALGSDHPYVAQRLNNLALLYEAQNNIPLTIEYLTRGLTVEDKNLKLIFAVGDEQRKQDYARTFTGTTNSIISLALNNAKNNQAAQDLALTTVLQRKGLVLDAVTDNIQILLTQEKNPEVKKLIEDWRQISQKLSNAVNIEQKNLTPEKRQANLQQLESQRKELEEKITNKSASFRQAFSTVTLAAVQSKIPINGALVEIVQYQPFNAKAKKGSEKWGTPRYAAAVLRNQGKVQWVDLGEAADIDKQALDLRNSFFVRNTYRKVGNLAYQKFMQPIIPLLGDAKHILIAPDGQLTQIPFEALRDNEAKFLVEKYQFSYFTSGRDLARQTKSNNPTSPPLLIGGVDYDKFGKVATNPTKVSTRGSNKRSGDLENLEFVYLAGTLTEVKAIKSLLPNSQILSGTSATEEAIKQVNAPSILHLATHGFFVADQVVNNPESDNLNKKTQSFINVENPLLRSGIALAGFNNRKSITNDRDDGVLTAQEFTAINLRGTKLVILSACETGKGDVKVGQGVYGLRRALTIAGSESQVMSLWNVEDNETRDLMIKFYQNLNAGMGRHEALRQAQLEFIKNPNTVRPYFWAAFIPSGDWSPLKSGLRQL